MVITAQLANTWKVKISNSEEKLHSSLSTSHMKEKMKIMKEVSETKQFSTR
jgi:hypothetical protein